MTLFMPRRRTRLVNHWTMDDIGRLRRLAEEGLPVASIALALRRSEFSIRNKAGIHGISLKRTLPERVAPTRREEVCESQRE